MTIYSIARTAAAAAALLLSCSTSSFAQSTLPFVSPLFTNNMVLQRDISDNVWGWTTPGQTVTVAIDNKTATATAGPDGKWIASIGPFKAGGPYTLTVSGPQTVSYTNVLVGDVWVCSGQSNMEFGIGNALNAESETAAANYPNIRIFTVAKNPAPHPQLVTAGAWDTVTPDTIKSQGTWGGFSAVGYYFGRDLQKDVNVPIGLIQTSWGGTPAEAWTSADALVKNIPAYNGKVAALAPGGDSNILQREQEWYAKNDPGVAGNWQAVDTDLTEWKPIHVPGYYQQAGIPELAYANGIIWFRTTFDLPAADAGKSGIVHIKVDDNDTTWINGELVGATDGVQYQRDYAIPAGTLKATGNVIAVRVDDTGGNGGIYGADPDTYVHFPDGQDIPLAGTWNYRIGALPSALSPAPMVIAGNPNYPTELYNGMIKPIEDYKIKGALWYQGEANSDRAMEYRTLLPTMIADWRARWDEGNFPFLIVQLAGYKPGGPSWPELRQAQWLTAQNVPNAGIVTAIDIGNISDVHPKNKQEVGLRLAHVAEKLAYGKRVDSYGPSYKSEKIEGSTIRIDFNDVDSGLTTTGDAVLSGFEIAGADGNFVAADAKIDGKSVVVSSAQVPAPVAVQYDWKAWPDGNLVNKADLPAFPFKTDEK